MLRITCLLLMLLTYLQLSAQDSLLIILSDELIREKQYLDSQPTAPYYIDYRGNDISTFNVASSFGSLTGSHVNHMRLIAVDLRVGDYKLDNTHVIKNSGYEHMNDYPSVTLISLDNKPLAIKQSLWRATNEAYKVALNKYQLVKNAPVENETKKINSDFSKEEPCKFEDSAHINLEKEIQKEVWEKRIKKYSEIFKKDSLISKAEAQAIFIFDTKYLVSSEGSRIKEHSVFSQILIGALIKSRTGELIPLVKTFNATLPSRLPSDNIILAECRQMLKDLYALRDAKTADPFSGPAIFSPAASGVFFHEIFGHRIEGQRMNNEDDGQTFRDKVNTQIMPVFISVSSDPTTNSYEGIELLGSYKYDEQGIAGKRVEVVKNGQLKNFLMSRSPLDNFIHSNGHGRAQAGMTPTSRQSNLFVESGKLGEMRDLRKRLISECRKQGKEYGYYFKEVSSGFTLTDRYNPNAFKVMPVMVYRIYVDGRPDELIRGVDMIGTPLNMFSEIEATSGPYGVFNGICGAESGGIPVSTVAPAIFVKKVETQRQANSTFSFPLLHRPDLQ
jgi:TldD protein